VAFGFELLLQFLLLLVRGYSPNMEAMSVLCSSPS
jgi:hypothetical protein